MTRNYLGMARLKRNYGVFMILILATCGNAWSALPVGPVSSDAPPTPEQLSIFVPVTGSLPVSATATVRYKVEGTLDWQIGHPLFRIRPEFSNDSAQAEITDGFAWTIIDLTPGTNYDVEVIVSSGPETEVLTTQMSTRSLPSPSGAATEFISAGATSSDIQAVLDSLSPGDVLEIADGTYSVDGLSINSSGTPGQPIYVRGQSRDGTILSDSDGSIIRLNDVSNLVLERLTLRGSGVDGGTSNFHWGVFGKDVANVSRFTLRNVSINGVNQGVVFDNEVSEVLIYDTTIIGNNRWTSEFIDSNLTWNDDGIRTPGYGNAVFNNTIIGFGDTLSIAGHVSQKALTDARGIHFYRNDVRNSGDDSIEADHGHRNLTFYDNRIHNGMTFLSLDPLYGGPLLAARNIAINIGRTPFKWNSQNSGQFVYNNTIVIAERSGEVSGWYQPNNGPQRAYGYRNNILLYYGEGNTLWIESGGHDPVDFTHNCWYPNRQIQWGGVWDTLEEAQQGIPNVSPVFSGTSRRLSEDRACERNPFIINIPLGADYHSEVTGSFVPQLAPGTVPSRSGIAISNVTDGHVGSAPDRGAIIEGRAPVAYGDRASSLKIPKSPTSLVTEQ